MLQRFKPFELNQIELPSAMSFPRLLETVGRLPLLVTGIAGVSGLNAVAFFYQRYPGKVLGQRPENNWPLHGPGIAGVNLENTDSLRRLIEQHQFRSVLSCGGSCALKSCELDPDMAKRINVDSISNLLDAIDGTSIRLVHLSIDLVYSGTQGGSYLETDRPDPVTVYGASMKASESLILERYPSACIGRISLPMGMSFNGHAGAIDWIQARFAKDKPATLYYDEVRTPTYVDCLNEVCEELLAGDFRGLYHLGGPRHLSLNQIAQIVNRVGGYDPDQLRGCYRIEAGPIPPRAGNVTMNSDKLRNTLQRSPFAPWPYYDELVPTHRNWHYERKRFPGSPALIQKLLYRRPLAGETLESLIS